MASLALATFGGCSPLAPEHPLDELRQPTGMALSDDAGRLFVTNGNWDRQYASGTLVVIDLERVEQLRATPGAIGASLTSARPCRLAEDGLRVECDPAFLIDEAQTLRLSGGMGNIGVDHPAGSNGGQRLLIPTRHRSTVTWVDVAAEDGKLALDCDQDASRSCGETHVVDVGGDPSRIHVDDQGFRFAYLPHLLGRRLTVIDLDGDDGPEVADVDEEIYREDEVFESGLGGGFAVAQLPCDLVHGPVHASSLSCTRPLLYSTHRFWPGVVSFRVAPGLGALLVGSDYFTGGSNIESAEPGPLTGDLAFVDPVVGDELLVVHTTPPSLARFDTTVNEEGQAANLRLSAIPVCNNPNLLAIHRPADGPWVAFVSCYGVDEVAAISLDLFQIVATIRVGGGANELLVDEQRDLLYVANTVEDSISLIELDVTSPSYLHEVAVLGVGTARDPQ